MKRKLLFFLALGLSAIPASAQFNFGPKAGLNLSRESFSKKSYTTTSRIGFFLGLFARDSISGSLSVQVDLYYSQEGTGEMLPGGLGSGHITTGNLELPVLVRYRVVSGEYVETGPQFNYLLSSRENFNGTTDNIRGYYHAVNPCWALGVGYQIGSGATRGVSLDLRVVLGLIPANKNPVEGGTIRTSDLALGLQYGFSSR